MEEINKDNHIDNNDSGISEEQKIWASQHLPNDPHFQEDDDDGNHETFQKSHENKSRHISVLEAKRIHSGTVKVRGRIVTVSEMYVIETLMPPNDLIYKDAKFIELEDTEKLNENERLAAILYDDLIQNVIAGEIVDIEGRMLIENKNNNKYSKKKIGVLHAESIRYVNRKELLITPRDIEAFERFAAYPNLILRLVLMFAPNVIGHEDAKLGLLRSIVGGDDHGEIGNGRINTFMVGDFGTAKSTLGNEATKIKPNSRHVSAPHASSKTITAIVDKENESVTLRLGAIPLSSYSICAIDEITAFPPEEQARLLDILQEGIFDEDKHGRHFQIPAYTTIIATANPIQSRWSSREIISNDEINLLKTLLDRFQQIYGFRDDMNQEQTHEFTKKLSSIRKGKPHNYNFLRKYLVYTSSIKIRIITPEAEFILNDFWEKAKLQGTLSIRMYRGLYNIAEATAKLYLKDVVDVKIAIEALESIRLLMVQYGETVKIPQDPRRLTYEKCLKILQDNSNIAVTIKSLFELACKDNTQIQNYIGTNLSMEHNHKIKDVIDMLRNHSRVREVNSRPIILQWLKETSDSESNTTAHSDVSDVSDAEMKNDNMNSKLESASYGSDGSDKNSIPVSVFYAKSILLNSVLSRTNSDKKNFSDSKTVSNTSHTSYRHNDNDKPLTLSEERLEEMKFVPISNILEEEIPVSNTGLKPVEGVSHICSHCNQLVFADKLSRELHMKSCKGIKSKDLTN